MKHQALIARASKASSNKVEFRGRVFFAQTDTDVDKIIARAQAEAVAKKALMIEQDSALGNWQLTPPEQLEDLNQEIVEGFNVLLYAKIFLFIFLLDLDSSYFTFTAIVFFLHANGLFRPIGRFLRGFRIAQRGQAAAAEPRGAAAQTMEASGAVQRQEGYGVWFQARHSAAAFAAFFRTLLPMTGN